MLCSRQMCPSGLQVSDGCLQIAEAMRQPIDAGYDQGLLRMDEVEDGFRLDTRMNLAIVLTLSSLRCIARRIASVVEALPWWPCPISPPSPPC